MNKSDVIKECIDTVIRETNLTPLEPNSTHERVIQHYATENGAKSAIVALQDMLIGELALEVSLSHAVSDANKAGK